MYLNQLKDKLAIYKNWLAEHEFFLEKLKAIIYQNDKRDILVEKITSYGIATIGGHFLGSLIGGFLTGGAGFLWGIAGVIGGVVASKVTFNKLYGKIRNYNDLNLSEKLVIDELEKLITLFKKDKFDIIKKEKKIYFTYYVNKHQKLINFNNLLKRMDSSELSYTYRGKFEKNKFAYKNLIKKFENSYKG